MFPLHESGYGARVPIEGDFMELDCESQGYSRAKCESAGQSLLATMGSEASDMDVHLLNDSPSVSRKSTVEKGATEITNGMLNGMSRKLQVKDLSRLWTYVNGGSPPDIECKEDGFTRYKVSADGVVNGLNEAISIPP
jgi:hypothetical protein